MSFKDSVMSGFNILKLDAKSVLSVSSDQSLTGMGFLFLVLAGVASAIGTFNVVGVIVNPIMAIVGLFVWLGVTHLLAMLFGGRADFMSYFRVLAFACILGWVSVIPIAGFFLGLIAALWLLVVNVVVLKTLHKLSTGKAVIVVLIPAIIVAVALFTMFALLAAIFFSSVGGF